MTKKRVIELLGHKKINLIQNDRKGRYSLAHFCENFKKVKIEVTGPKNAQFLLKPKTTFSGRLHFFTFFKNAPEYIDHSGHLFLMKFYVARTFLVELHLGVVLEVLLVVGSKFLTKLVDKYKRNIHRKINFLNFGEKSLKS